MSASINLRPVRESDSELLWRWRNDERVRTSFFNTEMVAWEEHRAWFSKRAQDPLSCIYVACVHHKPVGVIRFDLEGGQAVVSVNLDPDRLGEKLGRYIILIGTERFFFEFHEVTKVCAHIKKDNVASHKAFNYAKYERVAETETEYVYEKNKE